MTFLQPILLAGLPLVALPLLIHLINRRRHRTVAWGAMMFLLDAKRMTRGMARLRHWLIMVMRMLAIAALVFAIARPLVSGRVGLTLGGAPDTTIILLDRSASMQQQGPGQDRGCQPHRRVLLKNSHPTLRGIRLPLVSPRNYIVTNSLRLGK